MTKTRAHTGDVVERGEGVPRDLVADLRWLVLGPPLLSGSGPEPFSLYSVSLDERAAFETWLSSLGAAELRDLLRSFVVANAPVGGAPMRLGRYAERLLEFYLRHGPAHQLVAANVPVLNDRLSHPTSDATTLGELDFLVRAPSGEYQHWELIVKFFLAPDVPEPSLATFIGPDGEETFGPKLNKFASRQLRHRIPAPYDNREWQHLAFTRGCMFYRLGSHQQTARYLADGLHPDHERGVWLPASDLASLPSGSYVGVPRERWLSTLPHESALHHENDIEGWCAEQWRHQRARNKPERALMLSVSSSHRAAELGWSRAFVLPQGLRASSDQQRAGAAICGGD